MAGRLFGQHSRVKLIPAQYLQRRRNGRRGAPLISKIATTLQLSIASKELAMQTRGTYARRIFFYKKQRSSQEPHPSRINQKRGEHSLPLQKHFIICLR